MLEQNKLDIQLWSIIFKIQILCRVCSVPKIEPANRTSTARNQRRHLLIMGVHGTRSYFAPGFRFVFTDPQRMNNNRCVAIIGYSSRWKYSTYRRRHARGKMSWQKLTNFEKKQMQSFCRSPIFQACELIYELQESFSLQMQMRSFCTIVV